jgi:hypothetical protein
MVGCFSSITGQSTPQATRAPPFLSSECINASHLRRHRYRLRLPGLSGLSGLINVPNSNRGGGLGSAAVGSTLY